MSFLPVAVGSREVREGSEGRKFKGIVQKKSAGVNLRKVVKIGVGSQLNTLLAIVIWAFYHRTVIRLENDEFKPRLDP